MKTISPQDVAGLLASAPNAVLIDVREPDEVRVEAVPGSVSIPLSEIEERVDELSGYGPVLFMCRSGGRSMQAAQFAEDSGVADVHNVSGGIIAWHAAGLPIVRGGERGFAKQGTIAALAIVLVGVLAAAGIMASGPEEQAGNVRAVERSGASFTQLSAPAFSDAVAQGGAVLLDVRTPEEYAAGHIDGATNLNFYDPAFAGELAALDRNQPYLIYCQSGNRSGQTVERMRSLGFTNVTELAGGINAWNAAGMPLVR